MQLSARSDFGTVDEFVAAKAGLLNPSSERIVLERGRSAVLARNEGLNQPIFKVPSEQAALRIGQRLALARAMLQRPRVLILDEATSCLDASAEALILKNIGKSLTVSTLIVVSHRQSTFSAFRRLLVLFAGRVIEDERRGFFTEVGLGKSSPELPLAGGGESNRRPQT